MTDLPDDFLDAEHEDHQDCSDRNDRDGSGTPAPALVFECRLDAPPGKVWRALSIPALREHWLPGSGQGRPLSEDPPRQLELAWREAEPPHLESTVRFALRPDAGGGTLLTIVHVLAPPRLREAANEGGFLMRA